MWAEVSFGLSLDRFFTYQIPEEFHGLAEPGKRVLAPFKSAKKNWKAVPRSLDHESFERLILNQLSGETDENLILKFYKKTPKRFVLSANLTPEEEKELLKILKTLRGTALGVIVSVHRQKPDFKTLNIQKILDPVSLFTPHTLPLARWISDYYGCSTGEALGLFIPSARKPTEFSYPLKNFPPLYPLNPEQQKVFEEIQEHLNQFYPALIFGVTGSGKTEVYRHLVKQVLNQGKQSLILVPEISLTPQTVERFASLCGPENIAVIHSRMDSKEKLDQFYKIRSGKSRIILGPRSALFAPFASLGLMILDEEHEHSYKSGENPRYHARQAAFTLARFQKIPLILGSATPGLETFYAAKSGKIGFHQLKNRHAGVVLPEITLVDMKKETGDFSKLMVKKVYEHHQKGHQSILFMNRRGFSPFIVCKKCGHRFQCPNCSINLTYHKQEQSFACHTCGYEEPKPSVCPACGHGELSILGMGTEKLEEEMGNLFLKMKIARMDRDTTSRKGGHEKILESFRSGESDILVGTQMIAKGLDFHRVRLVGVVFADLTLNLPDFRSGENAFSLLAQVAGRAGRKEPGEVVIQTLNPGHFVLQKVQHHDYEGFYEKEIELRKKYGYPPFIRLVRLVIRGEDQVLVEGLAKQSAEVFEKRKIQFSGPMPCVLERVNKNYRFHLLFRVNRPEPLVKLIRDAVFPLFKSKKAFPELDVDPVSML